MFTVGTPMSTTISIRVDESVKGSIEELGYTPGEFLKLILDAELKRERSRRALAWMRENRLRGGRKSVEKLIREDRESR